MQPEEQCPSAMPTASTSIAVLLRGLLSSGESSNDDLRGRVCERVGDIGLCGVHERGQCGFEGRCRQRVLFCFLYEPPVRVHQVSVYGHDIGV